MQTAHNRTRNRIVQSRQNSRVKELRYALSHGGRRSERRDCPGRASPCRRSPAKRPDPDNDLSARRQREAAGQPDPDRREPEILILTEDVFHSAVTTETPQGIAALATPPDFDADDLFTGVPLVVVAAELRDPGNLGTLLRSSEAFGATGMILLPGTVSQWNPKALRASSGSAFRMPVISLEKDAAIALLRKHRFAAAGLDCGRGRTRT